MRLALHKLRILLQSDDGVINRHWRQLFAGWLESSREDSQADKPLADVGLQLKWVATLPPLPDTPPFFSDSHSLPDGVGILSVYKGEGEQVWLHYLDGALVRVPVGEEEGGATPVATGTITQNALDYGRFEDVTFTSLAPLLRRRGYYLIHAFAASKDGRAVLIVGPSGSGKTTSGLSLLLAGWQLLANDILLLEARPGGVYALPAPGGANIRPRTFDLLPGLPALWGDNPRSHGQFTFTSQQLVNGRWSEPTPIAAIYFPHIKNHARSTLQPVSRAVCLAHLMEESIDRWDEAGFPAHMNLLQKLSQQANAYNLHLGQDMKQLPGLLARNDEIM